MIKHELKDNVVHVSIAKKDFSFRIPVEKIGNTIDWKIGAKDSEGIQIKNVSTWTLQLFTKKITEEKYIKQFKSIVQEYCPKNAVNWEDTFMAVNAQNDYNWLKSTNDKTEDEVILVLKEKFNFDSAAPSE